MSPPKSLAAKRNLTFGPYRYRVLERVLEKDGKPVAIPEKTLEVLRFLLERPGELVTRKALKQNVWPGIFVEDSNIAFQISSLRKLLGERAKVPQFIETVPKRGYRFIAEVEEEKEAAAWPGDYSSQVPPSEGSRNPVDAATDLTRKPAVSSRIWIVTVALLASVASVALFVGSRARPVAALANKGSIVLADFENKTGDAVFDGTLRQGLLVELEQSPFLSLLSEQRVHQTLRLMTQPPGARLTNDIAMSICQRTEGTVVVEGSIERVGGLYVLGLRALSCDTGSLVDAEQAKTDREERVLDALGSMAARLRIRLGESAAMLQRHNTPLAEATTASAEALKAYTVGWSLHTTRGAVQAIPLLRHAVQLDPGFAMAFAALGRMYADVDESDLSAEALGKAWDLREHASDRERFFIAANYLSLVTGNLEEARKVAEAWAHTYPRDAIPHALLSGILNKSVARYEEAASQARHAIQLDPYFAMGYYNLGVNNVYLERLDEAAHALTEAAKRGLDIEEFRMLEYDLAFLRHDSEALERIVRQTAQRLGPVSWLVNRDAFREAYLGHVRRARTIAAQAIAEAERAGERERAGVWAAGDAVREAMMGNTELARRSAASALRLSRDREVQYGAGLALALAGDSTQARSITESLARIFPDDTTVRFVYLPVLRAQISLNDHRADAALDILNQAVPMELGVSRSPINTLFGALYPIYFRGVALCALGRGAEAAAELQKVIDHSGLVLSDPVGVLAHLGKARAYRNAGDRAKAITAYSEFFKLWDTADRDIPVLRSARAEFGRLNRERQL